jgi:16S rRNA (adenine1518-N6/adenine1519-N6)-dimethyltransferase
MNLQPEHHTPSPPPPRRSLGQNFLVNPETIKKIAIASRISPDFVTIELGIGRGALSSELCRIASEVIGIEKDSQLIEWGMENRIYPENMTIVQGDILDIDFEEIAEKYGKKLNIIGNLPYNISSQVVIRLIEISSIIARATLMFQKEVAQRLLAGPGTKAYGALSVQADYCFRISRIMDVSPGQFFPRPKVTSSVLHFITREFPEQAEDFGLFREVVRASFQQRRKKMINSLKKNLSVDYEVIVKCMEDAGIAQDVRAEQVCTLRFVRLANLISGYRKAG